MTNIITLKDESMNDFYVAPDNVISFEKVNDPARKNANAVIYFVDGSKKYVQQSAEEIEKKIQAANI